MNTQTGIEVNVALESTNYETCPTGTLNAVVGAVYDLGVLPTTFVDSKPMRKVAIMFEVEVQGAEEDSAPQRFQLSKIVTASLHEKSNLRGIVAACKGRELTHEELADKKANLGVLIGAPCMAAVAHTNKDGRIRATVSNVSQHVRGLPVLQSTVDPNRVPDWVSRLRSQAIVTTGVGTN